MYGGGSGCIDDGRCDCGDDDFFGGDDNDDNSGGGGCFAMKSITSNQLQCVMPSLSSSTASSYATSMNKEVSVCFDVDTVFLIGPHPWVFSVLTGQMSGLLTTSCDWAAILGNIGCESAGLTTWTQVKLQRGPHTHSGTIGGHYIPSSGSL